MRYRCLSELELKYCGENCREVIAIGTHYESSLLGPKLSRWRGDGSVLSAAPAQHRCSAAPG